MTDVHGIPWRCNICEHVTYDDRIDRCTICGAVRGATFTDPNPHA